MERIKLDEFGENETIRRQIARGHGEKEPYEQSSFEEANTLSLDVTYMFDSPEGTSIHREDVEEIVPRAVEANRMLEEGPAYAHYLGGVPNMTIEIPGRNAYNLGQFYYMMERSVAISGYLLGHNPFIQPGVESYKSAMFALIGKPGSEDKAGKMKERIKKLERVRIHAF